MSDEKKNLPENSPAQDTDDEQQIDSSAVGVSAETDAEGSSQTPAQRLQHIAEEHDVPVERDPADAKAAAEGSTAGNEGSSSGDGDRDLRGGDTKDDDGSEPPD
ncbi:hypothetical protein [Brevibacterium atlanticum]|uniref:hypothetical protein n=1 Tax=Brevibacterium atlanticum TaxID=2697563 RepID=UPI001421506B|nr:hypothetical protein [Brevibacterium atlanticum]